MSRSPSNFWRSDRTISPSQSANHQRSNSHGDVLQAARHTTRLPGISATSSQQGDSMESNVSNTAQLGGMRRSRRIDQRLASERKSPLQRTMRPRDFNLPIDLRMLDYVTTYDDNLVCPICRCPFVDPVVLTECDHCFCRDCMRQTWITSSTYNPSNNGGDCPACRTPTQFGPVSASKILVNILDDLVVKCPKSSEGCKAQVKRGEVQDHLSLYCGFAFIECPVQNCESPVRRNISRKECLHFPVSCLTCHDEMQKCNLEIHWQSRCPDRLVHCELCKSQLYGRELDEHNLRFCPSNRIKCPGEPLGCTVKCLGSEIEAHTQDCTLAKLAPIISAQNVRMDEQEAAQKQMSRKLEILESGFTNMESILFPAADNPDATSADLSSIPFLHGHESEDVETHLFRTDLISSVLGPSELPRSSSTEEAHPSRSRSRRATTGAALESPQTEFGLASSFPPPATNGGPFASPLHHILSMHESLRDELSRVNLAVQELDGRHSMQILNENMRTREEITYMGAQVAGLSRQVHWLTSTQLQRGAVTGGGVASGAARASGDVAAGPSVEEAINSAVRGAARIVTAGREGMGMGMRRGPSEEGRTKL